MTAIQLEHEVMKISRTKPHTLRRIAAHGSEPIPEAVLAPVIDRMRMAGQLMVKVRKGKMTYQAAKVIRTLQILNEQDPDWDKVNLALKTDVEFFRSLRIRNSFPESDEPAIQEVRERYPDWTDCGVGYAWGLSSFNSSSR